MGSQHGGQVDHCFMSVPHHFDAGPTDPFSDSLWPNRVDALAHVGGALVGGALDSDGDRTALGADNFPCSESIYNAEQCLTHLSSPLLPATSNPLGPQLDPVLSNATPWFPGSRTDLNLEAYPYPKQHNHVGVQKAPSDTVSLSTDFGDIVQCPECGQIFTGRYGRGNLGRHARTQHSDPSIDRSSCVCRICHKDFRRQDARVKHEWTRHKLEDAKPSRRQAVSIKRDAKLCSDHERVEVKSANEVPLGPLLESSSLEAGGSSTRYRIPTHSRQAHAVFYVLHAHFGAEHYDIFCEKLLSRWESIAAGLRLKRSETYDSYAQTLRVLRMQLCPRPQSESGALLNDWNEPNDTEYASKITPGKGKGPARGQSLSRSTQSGRAGNRQYGKQSKKRGSEASVSLSGRAGKPKTLKLDCPVYKYCLWYNEQASPCDGCEMDGMNKIRNHLDPAASKRHHGFVRFLQRCGRCKAHVVSQQDWVNGGHAAKTCHGRTQPHGTFVEEWVLLYLAIFPQETRVPIPYTNQNGWLPVEFVQSVLSDASRAALSTSESSTPFSAQQSPSHQDVNTSRQQPAWEFTQFNGMATTRSSEDTMLYDALEWAAILLAARNARSDGRQGPRSTQEVEFQRLCDHIKQVLRTSKDATMSPSPFPHTAPNLASNASTHYSGQDNNSTLPPYPVSSNTSQSMHQFMGAPPQTEAPTQHTPWDGSQFAAGATECPLPIRTNVPSANTHAQQQWYQEDQAQWHPSWPNEIVGMPGNSHGPQPLSEPQPDAWRQDGYSETTDTTDYTPEMDPRNWR